MTIEENKKYYHVIENWNGEAIESAADFFGNEEEAIENFMKRWPDAGVEMALYHVQMIHLYDNIAEAREHASCCGGEILEITDTDEMLGIESDDLEFRHPVCREAIDPEFIKMVG